MATKYTLTTAFTAITETSGTIQNVGNESVELASSTNAVAGEGIVLNPSEKRSFKGALSARSLGDAGTEVNVVDFTEAGEGGEEYVLPVASDTTLGGIKISNSFTVASDGTLNIKKSGKTILGAVKSSDDEGKVTVNNDGTMTYNPLGYRQPNTAYEVGNIAYHNALPTGWYLECTTAGTSGNGDLTISSPSIGSTVTDGTLTWKITRNLGLNGGTINGDLTVTGTIKGTASSAGLNISSNLIPLNSSLTLGNITNSFSNIYTASIRYSNNNSFTSIIGGTTENDAANLQLFGSGYNNNPGSFSLNTQNVNVKKLIGKTDGTLTWNNNDLAGSAITAKSLGTNGYIKYASGLILQWGNLIVSSSTEQLDFPISFKSGYSITAIPMYYTTAEVSASDKTLSNVKLHNNIGNMTIAWHAIGY